MFTLKKCSAYSLVVSSQPSDLVESFSSGGERCPETVLIVHDRSERLKAHQFQITWQNGEIKYHEK